MGCLDSIGIWVCRVGGANPKCGAEFCAFRECGGRKSEVAFFRKQWEEVREICVSSAGMGSQSATVSPLAKYKLVFLGDQSVGKFDFIIPFEHRNVGDVKCRRLF